VNYYAYYYNLKIGLKTYFEDVVTRARNI